MNHPPSLTKTLTEWVAARNLQYGARLPSVRHLAETWGVGRMALNRAVTEWVAGGILARNGNRYFLGNLSAADALVPQIDLLIERWHDSDAVERIARHWRIDVRVHQSTGPEDRRRQLLDVLESGKLSSGVLIYGAQYPQYLAQLEKRGVPVVVFGERCAEFSHVANAPAPMATRALRHLTEHGHREIGFVIPVPEENFDLQHKELEDSYRAACIEFGLENAAEKVYATAHDLPSLRAGWRRIARQRGQLSALVVEDLALAEELVRVIRSDGVDVPGKMSVVCLQRENTSGRLDTPLTSVRIDNKKIIELAAFLLFDDIEHQLTARGRPTRHAVLCEPRLFLGGTTQSAPVPQGRENRRFNKETGPAQSVDWPDLLEVRVRKVNRLNQSPLPGLPRGEAHQFESVNLEPFATRKLTSHYGWMGQLPLLHLPPGRTEMHGVPFEILSKSVVLRSRFARTCGGSPLPESHSLPVDRHVDGVCILHAGGWLRHHEAIGQYEFEYEGAPSVRVEIVAYGTATTTKAEAAKRAEVSLVQDWHTQTPYFSSDQAMPYLVTAAGDPLRYLRYLHVFHWKNPKPKKLLTAIQVRTLKPEHQATLAVLAITTYSASVARRVRRG